MTELEQSLNQLKVWSKTLTLALMEGPAEDAEATDVIVTGLVRRCIGLGAKWKQLEAVMDWAVLEVANA